MTQLNQHFWAAMKRIPPRDDPEGLEPDTRYHLTQALGEMMSTISEDTWAAGWLNGLEDNLPPALRARAIHGDDDELGRFQWAASRGMAIAMCAIADLLGHWADYESYTPEQGGGEQYVPYVPAAPGDVGSEGEG